MKKLLFIYNAYTGGGKLRTKLYPVLNRFNECGFEVHAIPTAHKGHATELTAKYAGHCQLLVCCGGDGTLNEVVNGLHHLEHPPLLGYIPGGTTNDFAANLRLPRNNMLKAAERVINPKAHFCYDIGLFNGRAYNYVAAFGGLAGVSYETPQSMKNLLGYAAYVLEGAQQLPKHQVYKLHVTGDGEELEGDFVMGFVSNSRSVGGFSLPPGFKAVLNDGLFEVILIRSPQSLPELASLSSALLTKNMCSPALSVLRAREIAFRFEEPVAWSLDGEFGGEHSQVDILVKQKQIRICI